MRWDILRRVCGGTIVWVTLSTICFNACKVYNATAAWPATVDEQLRIVLKKVVVCRFYHPLTSISSTCSFVTFDALNLAWLIIANCINLRGMIIEGRLVRCLHFLPITGCTNAWSSDYGESCTVDCVALDGFNTKLHLALRHFS